MGRPSKSETVEIYGLFSPEDNSLRYIGKSRNAKNRFSAHLKENRRKTPLYSWIASLRNKNLTPVLRVIETCPESDWPRAERQHIFESRLRGERLLNLADGGDQPLCTTEIRSKNAIRLNARLAGDSRLRAIRDAKRALSNALTRGWLSNYARQIMRECAKLDPKNFGNWANVPILKEDVRVSSC